MYTARRIKTGDIIKTFLGEESIQALKASIKLRAKGTRKTKPETITKESPLFITHNGARISRECFSTQVANAFIRHGEKHMSNHSLRKKLQTDLEKGRMPTNWIDQILGHQLINSRDAYSQPTDEELQEAYIKAYPTVRITPKQITEITKTTQEPEILEVHNLTEAKQAILKGYTQAGEFDGIKLYTKPK
jgi:integrase